MVRMELKFINLTLEHSQSFSEIVTAVTLSFIAEIVSVPLQVHV